MGCYVRGAFYIASDSEEKSADLFIFDPKERIILSQRKKDEGIFRFNTTRSGIYGFVFSNFRVSLFWIKILYL